MRHQHEANAWLLLSEQVVAEQLGVAAAAAADPGETAALLQALRGLAADQVWNVRRAAAEALPAVALAHSPAATQTLLELWTSLTADASSWVRSAALLAGSSIIARAPTGSVPPGEPEAAQPCMSSTPGTSALIMYHGANYISCRVAEAQCALMSVTLRPLCNEHLQIVQSSSCIVLG